MLSPAELRIFFLVVDSCNSFILLSDSSSEAESLITPAASSSSVRS
jgi:hypothetical protein